MARTMHRNVAGRSATSARSLADESFTPLLIEDVPERVRTKLESWGVLDFKSLFRRALGLHMVFSEPPPVECLSLDFLRRYHRYVDGWFELKMTQMLSTPCSGDEFTYELYASGEYTQMLEQSWKSDANNVHTIETRDTSRRT